MVTVCYHEVGLLLRCLETSMTKLRGCVNKLQVYLFPILSPKLDMQRLLVHLVREENGIRLEELV